MMMWRATAVALGIGICLHPAAAEPLAAAEVCIEEAAPAQIAGIADARSLALPDGAILRLAGIESFTLLLDEGDRAEAALRERLTALAASGPVRVRMLPDPPDRYGRQFALVEAAGGSLLQEMLAREGIAVAFASGAPFPCFDRIVKAEDEARRNRRGFWKDAALPGAEPAALQARIGRFVIFEGKVLSVGNRNARSYLNFGRRWSEDTTVEIGGADRARFGGEAGIDAFEGRRVRVRGFLSEHDGPVMTIRSPLQIEILDKYPERSGSKP